MRKETELSSGCAGWALVIWLVLVMGWIINIGKVLGCGFSPLTSEAVVRVVGIFVPPIGAIYGWF